MKIAIVGNSHVGMLRSAASQAEFGDVTFGWFANAGRGLVDAKVKGSCMTAGAKRLKKSLHQLGLKDTLDVDDYDATVFVGSTASALNTAYVLRHHVVAHWLTPEQRAAIRAIQFISEAAFVATLGDVIRANLTYAFVRDLRRVTSAPFFILPQPFLSVRVLDPDAQKYRVFDKVKHLDAFEGAARALQQAHDLAFADFENVTVLRQPPETIANHLFTRSEYSQGSIRLDQAHAHKASDMLHANTALGARYLSDLLHELD